MTWVCCLDGTFGARILEVQDHRALAQTLRDRWLPLNARSGRSWCSDASATKDDASVITKAPVPLQVWRARHAPRALSEELDRLLAKAHQQDSCCRDLDAYRTDLAGPVGARAHAASRGDKSALWF